LDRLEPNEQEAMKGEDIVRDLIPGAEMQSLEVNLAET
jgi:hypothetical protein